ncbi:ATP-binding protein [Streptomyces sp. NPDC051644]|uniref:ATP-binding protein n=1 Tax=Streptomyces sp. NPDC051644 TaxID=3365666 RepID=UPI00379EBB83
MSQPRFTDQLSFAAVLTAVNSSRIFTKITLTKWGAGRVLDDALLIVSELVTNAVKATGVTEPNPTWGELSKLKLINVRLLGLESSIVIEVWDCEPSEPVPTEAADDDENGRGLTLIDALSKRWGTYPSRGGKVVWAELPVHPLTTKGLPRRRKSSPSTGTPAEADERPPPDPYLLQRVIVGLQRL